MTSSYVVGAGAGLGRWLATRWRAVPVCRGDDLDQIRAAETIVYCAAKARRETSMRDLYDAMEDNLLLLTRVVRLPHRRFVFISSIDVYPSSAPVRRGDLDIHIEDLSGGYPAFKLMSEAVVRRHAHQPLVLRPASLFGPDMRENTIMKMARGRIQRTGLAADSEFNVVTWQMVGDLIDAALAGGITGVINCAAASNVTLKDVAGLVGYTGAFGDHRYSAGTIDQARAQALVPAFGRPSREILEEFLERLG